MTVPARPGSVLTTGSFLRERTRTSLHGSSRVSTDWRAPCAPRAAELWDPWVAPEGADPERARIALRDGSRVRLRSLRTDDRDTLLEWFEGLSPESRRLRFFGPKPALAPFEIERLLDVDGQRQHAIVAIGDGPADRGVAGIVRFVREAEDPRQAEIAIGVVDAYQSRGLGLLLLERILDAAECRGIERVVGEALYENRKVGRLVRRAAPHAKRRSLGITQQHVIALPR